MLSNIKTQLGSAAMMDRARETIEHSPSEFGAKRSGVRPRPMVCPICETPFGKAQFCARDGGLRSADLVVNGRYKLEETLGAGGTALVFGARHLALGKKVALKLLRPELGEDEGHRERFLREARVASQLEHENIVRVLDFGEHEGLPYLAMDYVTGPTLAGVLREQRRIAWQDTIPVLLQILRALSVAHDQNVVHRDLSPKNIVLSESSGARNVIKLCDFGLSRVLDSDDARLTTTGVAIGTPAYMAPEQIRGDAEQDHRVDIYAFGTIAHELVTGSLPHEGNTVVAMLASRLSEPPAPLSSYALDPEVPAEFEALVFACLSVDPAARPASVAMIETQLRALEAHAHTPMPTSLLGEMAGNFKITKELGSGGMGSVFLAEHPLIGTQVAIKVIRRELATSSEALNRFVREARAASAINSPHIPRYLDFGRLPDGRAFATMDYLTGSSLAEYLHTHGPMTASHAISIVERVAATIGKAHEIDILHRDIKPDNIFIEEDEQGQQSPKVLDFGIAKLLADEDAKQTRVGAFVGSPAYCAPEQASGAALLDASADIYALGTTLYEMLTGHVPFEGTAEDVMRAKIAYEAQSVRDERPELDALLASIVHKMIAREPGARYRSMNEVLEALAMWRAGQSTDQLVNAVVGRPSKRRNTVVAMCGTVVCGLVLLLVLGAWLLDSNSRVGEPSRVSNEVLEQQVATQADAIEAPQPPTAAATETEPAIDQIEIATTSVTVPEATEKKAVSRHASGRKKNARSRDTEPAKAEPARQPRTRSNEPATAVIIADPFE